MKTPFIIALIVFLAGAGAFWYFHSSDSSPYSLFSILYSDSSSTSIPSSSTPIPPLIQTYTDRAQGFSFKYPEGYTVREMPSDGGALPAQAGSRTLLVESLGGETSKSGIQISITPDDTNTSITAEIIRTDIPDMKVENPQSFPVGNNTGLAFKSDNAAFDGASREVWFVSGGHLYQISTYAESDPLLVALFATFKLP